MKAGDAIIGLASSGVHSNGYSLVRKLIEVAGADAKTMLAGKTLFDRLLEPTRIYVKSMLKLSAAVPVSAYAHITGGGLTDNIPRVLPDGMEAHLLRNRWHRDPVFDWLAETGRIEPAGNAPHVQLRHRHGGGAAAGPCCARPAAAAGAGRTGHGHRLDPPGECGRCHRPLTNPACGSRY